MANERFGKVIIGELSDNQTLPSSTAVDSTNMVYIGGQTGGRLWIDVYATTDITISTGNLLYITIEGFTADTAGSATAPFSINNDSGIDGASGTSEPNAHYCLLNKTTGDAELQFSDNDLITQGAIPEDLFKLLSYTWVQLRYETDANESSETVTAFVYDKQ